MVFNYITAAMLGQERAESNCTPTKACYNVQSRVLWDHQIESQNLLKESTYRVVRCLAVMKHDSTNNEAKFFTTMQSAVKPMYYKQRIAEDKIAELSTWISTLERKKNPEYIHSSPEVAMAAYYDRDSQSSVKFLDYAAFESHILSANPQALGYESINYLLVQIGRVIESAIEQGIDLPKRTDELVNKFGSPNWGAVMSQWFYLLLAENAFKVGKKYKTSFYNSLSARVSKLRAKIDANDDAGTSNTVYELEQYDELRAKLNTMESFKDAGPKIMSRGKSIVLELNRISTWAGIDFIVSTEIPEVDRDEAIAGFEELRVEIESNHAKMAKSVKHRTSGISVLEKLVADIAAGKSAA